MKKFVKITAVVLVAVMSLAMLVACGPSPDKMKERLESKGYTVEVATEQDLKDYADELDVEENQISAVLTAINLEQILDVDAVIVIFFKDAAAVKKAQEDNGFVKMQETLDVLGDFIKMTIKISGTTVYIGTEQGIADAK